MGSGALLSEEEMNAQAASAFITVSGASPVTVIRSITAQGTSVSEAAHQAADLSLSAQYRSVSGSLARGIGLGYARWVSHLCVCERERERE